MEYTYEFLRKCHGLRFRATIYDEFWEGVIKVMTDRVMLCYGEEGPGYLITFGRRDTLSFSERLFVVLPKDFEIVPRDPETYKDWQMGDKICRNGVVYIVIFRCGELVLYKDENESGGSPYTCKELFVQGYRLVLTDIERQIIEEKKVVEDIPKQHKFVKGEPVLVRDYEGNAWELLAFVNTCEDTKYHYEATDGFSKSVWRSCIPYNEKTMHLLGTTDDYKEEQP